MNTDENKKKIIMLFIALGLILSVILGVTFSYLAPTINNLENESTVAFNAGVIAIDFKNGTSQIEVSDILPGWSETKKFSLIATNTTSIKKADAMNYSLKLIVESNTFSDNAISVSLKSTNTSNNGTIAEIIPGTLLSGASEVSLGFGSFDATKEIGEAGATHDFELTVSFPEQYRSQNSDMGKHLSAHVTIGKGKQTISEYISKLDLTENGLEIDETTDKNIRYVGASPKNYLKFNDEIWRIIGVFNNITTIDEQGNEKTESLVKIVRNDSLGSYSWDSSGSTTNSGYGINEWSQADLMTELNTDYINPSPTSGTTKWYNGQNNTKNGSYDYSKNIKSSSLDKIAKVRWNTSIAKYGSSALNSYNQERSTTLISTPSDNVTRTNTWDGKIALMYPSDYGYASTDTTCRNNLSNCDDADSKANNWLFNSAYQWTLSPYSGYAYNGVFNVYSSGGVSYDNASATDGVRPALFLKSDVVIAGGTGESIENAYTLE